MAKSKFISKNQSILIIFTVFLLLFSFVFTARILKNESIPSEDSYKSLFSSKKIHDNGFKINGLKLHEAILSFFNQDNLIYPILILFLFSALSIMLIYLILSYFGVSEQIKLFSILLLLFSPPFIYSFSTYTSNIFILFFVLLFAYFYLKKKFFISFLSTIPLIFISLPTVLINLILIEVLHLFYEKDDSGKEKIILSFSIIIFSLISYSLFFFGEFIPNLLIFSGKTFFTQTISDFGAILGFGIFHLILAIIGIIILWELTKKYLFGYLTFLLLFILSIFFPILIIVLNVVLCFFASIAISAIYKKKWEIEVLKNLTLLLIICGVLFSCFSYETRIVNSNPTRSEISALNFLKEKSDGIVLSHQKNGYLINYFSEKNSFIDENLPFLSNGKENLNISNEIFYSRNLEKTRNLLRTNNINYVFIDSDMKEGLIFEKRNEGLLFIMDNNEKYFTKIYDENSIEIWEFIN